jgi:translin
MANPFRVFILALDIGIKQIEKKLSEREKILDGLLGDNRMIVRSCSNAIKAMHARDITEAKKFLEEAEAGVGKVMKYESEFPDQLNHILQEYSEARIVQAALEMKAVPSISELKVPEVPYLNGLLDAIGELKREMYESLRRGDKIEAEGYFKMMEEIFDELLPLRFSNAILPEFRRKQDSARHQIEQARGELI